MKNENPQKALGMASLSLALVSLAAWMVPAEYFHPQSENEFIRALKKKTASYTEQLPQDKVYLQFDKPFYEPGETIWFAAYVRDGQSLKPSGKSDIVHVELLNPKGTVERSINLIAKDGIAAGDFFLDKETLGGMYKVRAYTNWMKNEGEANVFQKDIQVQDIVLPNLKMKLDFEKKAFGSGDEVVARLDLHTNENKALSNYKIRFTASLAGEKLIDKAEVTDEEGTQFIKFKLPAKLNTSDGLLNVLIDYNGSTESVSRSIPIVLNKIRLDLFPEGGDLVCGEESRVAFRALNEFGKPADIEGLVLNDKGNQVSSFSSFHQGMGAFSINPQNGEKYVVKITKPEGIGETYALPEAMSRGYVLNVDGSKNGELGVDIKTTEREDLSLVAQVRGKIFYTTNIESKPGSNRLVFSTNNFPMGIAQLTLFDAKGIARAERLAFVNNDRQLSISVATDKDKYLPREKVKMTVTVKDEKGIPMPAHLSLAVVNDQLLSFADDKSGNLLSQLLLEQDIKEKVEEPAFYFDRKETKSGMALDYLLMTAGWRRFGWEKVMDGNLPIPQFQGERAIVAGTVLDANTGKPLKNARIKILNGVEYESDENGKFIFNKLDLSNPVSLTYSAEGHAAQSQMVQQYNQAMLVYLYDNTAYYSRSYYPASRAGEQNIPAAAMGAGGAPVQNMEEAKWKNEDDVAQMRPRVQNKKSDKAERHVREALVDQERTPQGNAVVKEKEKKEKHDAGFGNELAKVMDVRGDQFRKGNADSGKQQAAGTLYYRARQFASPAYTGEENTETRSDFRNTIYWNPDVDIDRSGKKTLEFFASDDITSFRSTIEGIAADGMPGRAESVFYTQLPFVLSTKIPVEVATQDDVSIPLTLKNNTDKPLGGILTITAPSGLKELVHIPDVQTLMPGKAKTIYLDYKVLDKIGYGDFTIAFKSCGLGDAFTQKIKIAPKGFPVNTSFSGQEAEKEYGFEMAHVVPGSVVGTFTAFPNVVSDLMKGVEGILREPSGCFEQTSMSSYPNAMVLDYLKATDSKDEKELAYAGNLLDKGYKRLLTFETKDRGYEWFGSNPGHEALTAYGLMQFTDMKKVGEDVDMKMMERTAAWLISRKDGKGGFLRSSEAADAFGRANEEITNAYIVYALSEAGFRDIGKEFESAFSKAMKSGDPYQLALAACSGYNLAENAKADKALEALVDKQDKNGSWTGLVHSVTCSTGKSLTVETTSLAIMAILKSNGKNPSVLTGGIQFLVSARSGSGEFGNTQGTILALKALTSYAKYSRKTGEAGTVLIYVDGTKVAEKSYKAGEKDAVVIEGLGVYLQGEGKHEVKVKYTGTKTPLPYAVAVNWSTTLPSSAKECAVELKTKLAGKSANVGETMRLTATLSNKKNEGIPSTMALIGIPAGFTVQPWQLKEMQEKKVFDYYEVKGNNIAIYYRCMAPNAVKEINLDLKAEMPGEYDAPASSAYLYYTNELKSWSGTGHITIRKNSI